MPGALQDASTDGEVVGGVPVVGTIERLGELICSNVVNDILLAVDDLSSDCVGQVISECQGLDTRVIFLPSYQQLLKNQVAISPHKASINDLLRVVAHRATLVDGVRCAHGWIGWEPCWQVGHSVCKF